MQHSIGTRRLLVQKRDRLLRGDDRQLYSTAFGFTLYVIRDREGAIYPRPDHQLLTVPRDVLLRREWRVPKLAPELLRSALFAFSYFPAVDDYVVLVLNAIDPDRAKGQVFEHHVDCMLAPNEVGVTSWMNGVVVLRPDS